LFIDKSSDHLIGLVIGHDILVCLNLGLMTLARNFPFESAARIIR
jgi:hypothetical protein